MRCAILLVMLAMLGARLRRRPPPADGEFFSSEQVTGWISNYRTKPDPARLPAAVRALSRFGAFKDPESSGVYVGFLAGVIGANPDKAEELIGKMLPLPPGDQWAIIRAIAYSNHPDWKGLLRRFAERMPQRQVMIDRYLDGKLPTLDEIPLEKKKPTLMEKVRGYFDKSKEAPTGDATFDGRPELLDTLWGYYFATGAYRPIARIIDLAALVEGPRQHRQAHRRQHGEVHARQQCRARHGAAGDAQARQQAQGQERDPRRGDRGGRDHGDDARAQGGARRDRGAQAQGTRLQARYLDLGPGRAGRAGARLHRRGHRRTGRSSACRA